MKKLKVMLVGILIILASSCGGGGGGNSTPTPLPVNVAPTADAGEDQSVEEQTMVELLGAGVDSDGSVSSYLWTQISGVTASVTNSTMATASFTAPTTTEELILEFDLTVTDNDSDSHTDRVVITVLPVNVLPEINFMGVTETLETSSFAWRVETDDSDGEVVDILWEQISGSDVGLLPEQVTTSRVDLDIPSVTISEVAFFKLTVTDNEGGIVESDIELLIHDSHQIERTNRLTDTGAIFCGNYAESTEPDEVHANDVDCSLIEFPESYPIPQGQDGHYGLDVTQSNNVDGLAGLKYIKLDNFGDILPDDSETWSCVLDQVTGLIWEVKHEGPEFTASHNRFTWFNENSFVNGGDIGSEGDSVSCSLSGLNCNTATYVQLVNDELMCGSNQMRLPTPRELLGLISLKQGDIGTKVDIDYFPFLHTGNSRYWTSTPFISTSNRAYVVDFLSAKLTHEPKSNTEGILLVRHYEP